MKFKPLLLFLVVALLMNNAPLHAMEQNSLPARAMNAVINKYNQVKECFTGQKPCKPSDFATLAAALLIMYGIARRLRSALPLPQSPRTSLIELYRTEPTYELQVKPWNKTALAKEAAKRVPYYVDPAYWGTEATEAAIQTGKSAARGAHRQLYKAKYKRNKMIGE